MYSRWLRIAVLYLIAVSTAVAAEREAEIAYLRFTAGYWQVWVTDADGAKHRQLTFNEIDKTRISWSDEQGLLLCNQNNGELTSVSLDGEMVPISLPITGMLDAAWSSNGQHIAFSATATQTLDNNDLWVVKTDGKGARKLTNQPGVVQSPSWHPTQNSLAYALVAPGGSGVDIWSIDIKSGSREQKTPPGNRYFGPTYNAAGNLLYSVEIQNNYDIWEMNAKGASRQLTVHAGFDADPSDSPSGEQFVFYSLRDGNKRIWIKKKGVDSARPITPENAQSRYPVWLN